MDNEILFREIPREKKKRRKKHLMVRFLAVVAIVLGIVAFLFSPVFNVRQIEVIGNQYYTDEEIINMGGARTGVNLLFHPGKKDIEKKLSEDPYFEKVTVGRKLPATLTIEVKERQQVAAVVYGNGYVVIDVDGLVLRTTDTDPKLTILTGLTLSKIKGGEKIQAVEKQTLKTTLEMVSTMRKGDFYFKKIEMSDRYITAYIFDTLIVKGTPKQMKSSIDQGDLQKVVNKLYKNKTRRGTISLGEHNYISFSPAF